MKVEILKKVGGVQSKSYVTNEYGINKGTFSTYLRNKDSIIQSWSIEKFRKDKKANERKH